MEATPAERVGYDLLILLFGVGLGVVGTLLLRGARGRDKLSRFPTGGRLEGRILEKLLTLDWLLLKVETKHGVLLATFREMPVEIDLLVDPGDAITLDVREYRPTLEDPRIEKVRRPPPIEPDTPQVRIGGGEEHRIPERQGVERPPEPTDSRAAA